MQYTRLNDEKKKNIRINEKKILCENKFTHKYLEYYMRQT